MPRLSFALAVMLLSVASPALAAEASGDGGTVLHLSEQAQRPVARDRLRAVLRVEGSDSDAARLQAEINRRQAAAVARAKNFAGVSVFTSGYGVYEQHAKDQPPQWHGSAGLTLTGSDAAPLLALVGELQQSGLLMSALSYELTPQAARTVEDELTDEALGRLRQRAERIAGTLGLAVLRLRDLRVGSANGAQPQPFLLARAAAAAAPAPVAEPGEAAVSVSVDADVELGPKR
jgi:predicted secreted protein